MINALDYRKPDYPIEKLFVARWSPRAMTGEPLSQDEINMLFEAARWAPSTYNEQEWRFLFSRGGTPPRQNLFFFFVGGKQAGGKKARIFVGVLAPQKVARNGKAKPGPPFDFPARIRRAAGKG